MKSNLIHNSKEFLQVYLVRPSRCQELADPCKTLVYVGPSKSDFWENNNKQQTDKDKQVPTTC